MKKVLVPVDGEGLDPRTLVFAKDFAINQGAQLQVITVLPYSNKPSHPQLAHLEGVEGKALMDVSKEVLENAVKQLADAGVSNINTAILTGDPASAIIDYADEEECDLILIHTHGMGVIKRFAVGSVTNTVVHHANVPVFVVK